MPIPCLVPACSSTYDDPSISYASYLSVSSDGSAYFLLSASLIVTAGGRPNAVGATAMVS